MESIEAVTTVGLIQPRPSPKMDAIFNALEEGWPGARRNEHPSDWYVCWGLIGNNALIMHEHPTRHIFCDMPYHGRLVGENFEESYWRFCLNGLHDNRQLDVPSDRFKSWNREIKDWNTKGENILFCPSSETMTRTVHGWSVDAWLYQGIESLKALTDTPIKVRHKPRKKGTSGPSVADVPLEEDLAGAKAVVTTCSIVAAEAMMEGVPVFTTSPDFCPAAWCAQTDFSKINDPWKPSDRQRESLLNNLAYKQFSIREMREGIAYNIAMEYLGFR